MEFVVSKKGKTMLLFMVLNMFLVRCYMKTCWANIFEKEKEILETKGTFFTYK
jgi:hypothetical protein